MSGTRNISRDAVFDLSVGRDDADGVSRRRRRRRRRRANALSAVSFSSTQTDGFLVTDTIWDDLLCRRLQGRSGAPLSPNSNKKYTIFASPCGARMAG